MKHLMGIGLAVAAFVALSARAEDAKKFDAAKLVGKWQYTAGTKNGEKVDKERLVGDVEVTKDTFTLPAGPDAKFVMAYKLDTKGSPAKIDLDIKDGPVKEGKAEGIIDVNGDELKICYVPMGGKRPEKFESTKDNGAFYFTLKRVK